MVRFQNTGMNSFFCTDFCIESHVKRQTDSLTQLLHGFVCHHMLLPRSLLQTLHGSFYHAYKNDAELQTGWCILALDMRRNCRMPLHSSGLFLNSLFQGDLNGCPVFMSLLKAKTFCQNSPCWNSEISFRPVSRGNI